MRDVYEWKKAKLVWWGDREQLLHERKAASSCPPAGRRKQCTLETLSSWTWWQKGWVLNEADQRLQDLPCQTSERGSAHWNVKSRLHPELKGWIPPSPTCQGGASDWPARGPRGRNRPSPTSRGERQRPWEKSKREEAAWQLKTLVKCYKPFFKLSLSSALLVFST